MTDLRIERTFDAPRTRVFDAWSNPDVLRRWWAAGPDWTTSSVEVDLRPGGRYRLAMEGPAAGTSHTVSGVFIEVLPPERLVYTWAWETPESPSSSLTTHVTVDFVEHSHDRTTVVVTHSGFNDDSQRELHADGWGACLNNLAERVLST